MSTEVSPITKFAIRVGGSCRWKMTFPGYDADEFFFVLKQPSGQSARMGIASAGLRLAASDGDMDTRLDLWAQFLAKADAQIVDFTVPAEKEDGTPLSPKRWSRNPSNNHAVYDSLPTNTIGLLQTAMAIVAGDEESIGEADRQAWEELKNAHSELLMPLARE